MASLRVSFLHGFWAIPLAGALGLSTAPGRAAGLPPPSGVVTQQSVYAAFIVNVTRFIQWPSTAFRSPDEPLVIGTFAHAVINDELDGAVRGESVGNHPLRTRRIHSLDDLASCHVIYLEGADAQVQNAVLNRIAGKPVLSIGDSNGFLELGGHIRFVPRPPRTQLRIGLTNLKASGLQARAQLLRLAQAAGP